MLVVYKIRNFLDLKTNFTFLIVGILSFSLVVDLLIFYTPAGVKIFGFLEPHLIHFYSPTFRLVEFGIGSVAYLISRRYLIRTKTFRVLTIISTLVLLLLPMNFSLVRVSLLVFLVFFILLNKRNISANPKILIPIIYLGDRSYSIYLIHLPLIWLAKRFLGVSNLYVTFSLLIIILILSELNYRFVEKVKIPSNSVREFYSKASLLVILPLTAVTASTLLFVNAYEILGKNGDIPLNTFRNTENCYEGAHQVPCDEMKRALKNELLLIGDSHANALKGVLTEAAILENYSVVHLTNSGCFLGQISKDRGCENYGLQISQYLKSHPNSKILVAYRSTNDLLERFGIESRQLFLQNLVEKIGEIDEAHKILLIGPNPEFPDKDLFFSDSIKIMQLIKYSAAKNMNISYMNQQAFLDDKYYKQNLYTRFVSVINLFCNDKSCSRYSKGQWEYADFNHLSYHGSEKLLPIIRSFMKQ